MEQQIKPFGLIDTILLLEIAVVADIANVVTFFMMLLPIIGEIVLGFDKVLDVGVGLLIVTVFIFKTRSFGAMGIVEVAGGIASSIGIPAQTIAVLIGVYLANHPKAAVIATLGGTGMIATGEAALAGETTAGAMAATITTGAAEKTSRDVTSETRPQKPVEIPISQSIGVQPMEEPQIS